MFDDIWRTHQLFGLLFASAGFSILMTKTMGKAYGAALFYALASAVWLFQNPEQIWPGLMIRIDATAANSAVVLILISAIVALIAIDTLQDLFAWLFWIVVANCAYVLYAGHGMFHACSMDTAAAALFVPYAFEVQKKMKRLVGWAPLALLIFTVVVTHGTTAFVMLFAMVAVQLLYYPKQKKEIFTLLLTIAMVAAFSLRRHFEINQSPHDIWGLTSGRSQNWVEMFTWWGPNGNWLLGTGTGSYQWLSPAIVGRKTIIFLWMHNEYLQALFEQGAIGLSLFLLVGVRAAQKAKPVQWLFTTFVGLSVLCLTQFPFRFFVTQLAIVALIRLAMETKHPSAPLPTGKVGTESNGFKPI